LISFSLTDLQNQLIHIFSKHKNAVNLLESPSLPLHKQNSETSSLCRSSDVGGKDGCTRITSGASTHSLDVVNVQVHEQTRPISMIDSNNRLRRKRNLVCATPAWSHCEALSGIMLYLPGKFVVHVYDVW